ncbi:carbonic anhydrase [Aerococcaceae bacterium DSM 111022]|nr:carbonic anhydrase [Aerococcaceae bacterium DSM 111022]
MKQIQKRLQQFQEVDFHNHQELFEQLSTKQEPHTLFIGCSDSRVNAELLFQALPGEIFQLRNIANIVPHVTNSDRQSSTLSVIEYAVTVLEVDTIIICGHSNCGGCRALLGDAPTQHVPHTLHWLDQMTALSEDVQARYNPEETDESLNTIFEKLNVLEQVKNLMSHEFIQKAVQERSLEIIASYYDIGSGHVFTNEQKHEELMGLIP